MAEIQNYRDMWMRANMPRTTLAPLPPEVVGASISTAEGNALQERDGGLFVAAPEGGLSSVAVGDTAAIKIEGDGTENSPLRASAVISAVPDNALQATANGLYVPPAQGGGTVKRVAGVAPDAAGNVPLTPAHLDLDLPSLAEAQAGTATTARIWSAQLVAQAAAITRADSTSVTFTGTGRPGAPLTAAVRISPDAGNALTERANGLFAAAGGGGGSGALTGDTKITAREIESGWISTGSIYQQSAYPVLFGIIGLVSDIEPQPEDLGAEWTLVMSGAFSHVATDGVTSIAARTSAPRGVLRSIDGGVTWPEFTSTGVVAAIAIDGNLAAFSASNMVYCSTDAGRTWVLRLTLPGSLRITGISIANGVILIARGDYTSNSGVWRSPDGGLTWAQVISGVGYTSKVVASGSAAIVCGPNLGAPKISGDTGESWDDFSTPYGRPRDAEISGDEIMVSADPGAIISTDAGVSWSEMGATIGQGWEISLGSGIAFIVRRNSNPIGINRIPIDLSLPWSVSTPTIIPESIAVRGQTALAAATLAPAGLWLGSGGGGYSYDPATQFLVPRTRDTDINPPYREVIKA